MKTPYKPIDLPRDVRAKQRAKYSSASDMIAAVVVLITTFVMIGIVIWFY